MLYLLPFVTSIWGVCCCKLGNFFLNVKYFNTGPGNFSRRYIFTMAFTDRRAVGVAPPFTEVSDKNKYICHCLQALLSGKDI